MCLMLRGKSRQIAKPSVEIVCELPLRFGDAEGFALPVYVEEGYPTRYGPKDAYDRNFRPEIVPGSSIGTESYPPGAGTFGGYLKDEAGKVYGLSVFHLFATTNQECIKDKPVSQPDMDDIQYDLEFSKKTIDDFEKIRAPKPRLLEKLEWYRNHLDELERQKNTRVCGRCVGGKMDVAEISDAIFRNEDWALLEIRNRRGKNVIPQPSRSGLGGAVLGVGALEIDQDVYKYGRSTGPTTGVVSGIKCDVRLEKNGTETCEFFVSASDGTPFSRGGDSGAWVVNTAGEVVGMVLGGCDQRSISYVTPMEFLLKRIEVAMHLKLEVKIYLL